MESIVCSRILTQRLKMRVKDRVCLRNPGVKGSMLSWRSPRGSSMESLWGIQLNRWERSRCGGPITFHMRCVPGDFAADDDARHSRKLPLRLYYIWWWGFRFQSHLRRNRQATTLLLSTDAKTTDHASFLRRHRSKAPSWFSWDTTNVRNV